MGYLGWNLVYTLGQTQWLDIVLQTIVTIGLLSPVFYYILRRHDRKEENWRRAQENALAGIYDAVNRVEEDERVPGDDGYRPTLGSLLRSVSKDVSTLRNEVRKGFTKNSNDHADLYRHVTEVHQSLTERIDKHDERLFDLEKELREL